MICPPPPRLVRIAALAFVGSFGAGPLIAQTITVYSSGNLPIATTKQLTAYVPLSPNAVTWTVNGIAGGNATVGTVSDRGLYTAPAAVPMQSDVTVTATSTAYPAQSGSVTLSITQVQPRLWSVSPTAVPMGAFTIRLNGAAFPTNVAVRIGDVNATVTRISATQLQASATAPSAWLGKTQPVQVWATGLGTIGSDVVNLSISASAPAPAPTPAPAPAPAPSPSPAPAPAPTPAPGPGQGTANLAAARFLEQATFGPNAASVTRVQSLGQDAWLTEQFGLPETVVATPTDGSTSTVAAQMLNRLTDAPDQLRQRVAYALAQVIVISANKNIYAEEIAPHLRTLSKNAFGNYRALLEEVARSPQMGKYLDLANSNRPLGGSSANENFARELMQLFTIGLVKLNTDGTPQLDLSGRTIPTYDQSTIQQVALALTGWTYAGTGTNNWENFSGPMVLREVNHDQRAKSFLGCNLPASQGTDADLKATLDCLFQHPNTPPFVSQRLIRQLVKSNPSAAYVQRIAAVFINNGSGVRGDLKAVVRAILLDSEARNDTAGTNDGRLRDPIQHIAAMLRALNGGFQPGNQLSWEIGRTGQTPLTPPSVFGHYSQLFRLPQTTLAAPEFQIYTPTEATLRGNFLWALLTQPGGNMRINLQPFTAVANDTTALINAVDQALLWGRMSPAMRQSLANAINAQPDATQRMQTALYLTLLSGQHAIQH
ncbi:uncharacterized protein (DUF1800 family) [Pelomonas saccharophila]|uniref:Uncharacterized protein (DUF1800 family) n=1 Tax=Roseateles saccharophilus TaxID=304 RepID=A0ABU1YVX0_ROSSA|nr:DUF1800 domain-containing protein [Roseateles saccharophilus]MDR7272126.1 uncharacterized protein (DUF1800 family) [Roseateles saccharophilus]